MARDDLDARRAQQEPHVVVLGGAEYTLPVELPLSVAQDFIAGNLREALAVMFGDQAPAVIEQISMNDLLAIAAECYGLTVGESQASSVSSKTTGTPSTPTSSVSTA